MIKVSRRPTPPALQARSFRRGHSFTAYLRGPNPIATSEQNVRDEDLPARAPVPAPNCDRRKRFDITEKHKKGLSKTQLAFTKASQYEGPEIFLANFLDSSRKIVCLTLHSRLRPLTEARIHRKINELDIPPTPFIVQICYKS